MRTIGVNVVFGQSEVATSDTVGVANNQSEIIMYIRTICMIVSFENDNLIILSLFCSPDKLMSIYQKCLISKGGKTSI